MDHQQQIFGHLDGTDLERSTRVVVSEKHHHLRLIWTGVVVGSIGEVVAAYIFDLELEAASNKGFDAKARCDRREVEIKFTQSKSVGIRYDVEHLIVMQKLRGQRLRVVYNGRGASVWGSGKTASNGQKQISIAALQKLDALEPAEGRLPLINQPPI